jgi:hypothetical protein
MTPLWCHFGVMSSTILAQRDTTGPRAHSWQVVLHRA